MSSRIAPERAFTVGVRVPPYFARLDDGSQRRYRRQDLDWVVDLRGFTFDKFMEQLGEKTS